VPAEGLLFATQEIDYQGSSYVRWGQRDPLGITETGKGIYDPLGNYIPFQQHDDPRPAPGSYNSSSMSGMAANVAPNPFGSDTGCLMDGLPATCGRVLQTLNHQGAKPLIISGTQNPLVVLASQGIVFQTSQEAVKVPQDPNPGPDSDPELSWMAGLENVEAVSYVSLAPGGQGGFTPNPQNPVQTRQPATDPQCDARIAAIFGGPGAVAATVYEPPGVNAGPGDNRYRYDHLAGQEYSTSTPMPMAQTRSPDRSFLLAADLFPEVSTITTATLRTTFAIAMQADHTRVRPCVARTTHPGSRPESCWCGSRPRYEVRRVHAHDQLTYVCRDGRDEEAFSQFCDYYDSFAIQKAQPKLNRRWLALLAETGDLVLSQVSDANGETPGLACLSSFHAPGHLVLLSVTFSKV
jgi:hypothetical protein